MMDSQQPPGGIAIAAAATSSSSSSPHRKGHKASSSLGSLYEVLADLDETQLHYLIQEMNHTGHQNVPVSQAVSAFEGPNVSESLTTLRRSSMMLPPHAPDTAPPHVPDIPPVPSLPGEQPGVQRHLSKSQQGKLRLQTAFQRAPSLRDGRRQESVPHAAAVQPPVHHSPVSDPRPVSQRTVTSPPVVSVSPTTRTVAAAGESRDSEIRVKKRQDTAEPALQTPAAPRRRRYTAYKRIPRPDFDLPSGVTVTDLLRLLEVEYLSSKSQDRTSSTSTSASSPSSAVSGHLAPAAPRPLLQTPSWPGARPLRRHSSRLDMMLDAERTASGAEEIGLGMLEPRPLRSASVGTSRSVSLGTSAASTPVMSMDSFDGFGGFKSDTPPPVMEGIFDVLENQ